MIAPPKNTMSLKQQKIMYHSIFMDQIMENRIELFWDKIHLYQKNT